MALTLAEISSVASDTAWQARVAAAIYDVSATQIRALSPTAPNYTQLIELGVRALTDLDLQAKIWRLVAAGLPGAVVVATPVSATGTDAQIRTQVRSAFDALVVF